VAPISDNPDGPRPTLRLISGDATPEEIAAILALMGARGGAIAAEHVAERSAGLWSSPGGMHRRVRGVQHASPHGWRTSFWPH
jgi:Acyl-CoA carboxylase epsilon subunit